jgi:hypothetical protein
MVVAIDTSVPGRRRQQVQQVQQVQMASAGRIVSRIKGPTDSPASAKWAAAKTPGGVISIALIHR